MFTPESMLPVNHEPEVMLSPSVRPSKVTWTRVSRRAKLNAISEGLPT